jgi:hypothetical protein
VAIPILWSPFISPEPKSLIREGPNSRSILPISVRTSVISESVVVGANSKMAEARLAEAIALAIEEASPLAATELSASAAESEYASAEEMLRDRPCAVSPLPHKRMAMIGTACRAKVLRNIGAHLERDGTRERIEKL